MKILIALGGESQGTIFLQITPISLDFILLIQWSIKYHLLATDNLI